MFGRSNEVDHDWLTVNFKSASRLLNSPFKQGELPKVAADSMVQKFS